MYSLPLYWVLRSLSAAGHADLVPFFAAAARWSVDNKWKTVSVDQSGTVATKTDPWLGQKYGYIQTVERISHGVHTW